MSVHRPRSIADLFLSFSWLALQGFGGVLAVVQHELVERKQWLTREEFVREWAVAQVMPGPNVINLSIVLGARYFGWRGAVAALAGMVCAPMVLVLVLAWVSVAFAEAAAVQGALRGMGGVAAGLVLGSGLKMIPALRGNVLGWACCLAIGGCGFLAVVVLKWSLSAVVAILGPVGVGLAWRRLAP